MNPASVANRLLYSLDWPGSATPLRARTIETPIGSLTLAGDDRLLYLLMVEQAHAPDRTGWQADPSGFDDVVEQLAAYFAGELRSFDVAVETKASRAARKVEMVVPA